MNERATFWSTKLGWVAAVGGGLVLGLATALLLPESWRNPDGWLGGLLGGARAEARVPLRTPSTTSAEAGAPTASLLVADLPPDEARRLSEIIGRVRREYVEDISADRLLDEAARRWPLESVRVVHRLGVVRVGEPSLWMEVVSPHRAEAFDACRWIIDEMKRVVPIWKRAVPVVA